jgi:Bacterial PH domain
MGFLSGMMGNAGVVEADELNEKYEQLLTGGESIEVGFKVIRDTFVFTNKRLIIVDV